MTETVLEAALRQLLFIRQDAEMALSGEWDKDDDGFEAQIELIDEVLDSARSLELPEIDVEALEEEVQLFVAEFRSQNE